MNINEVGNIGWFKIWAGSWSFLTCSHFGEQYTKTLKAEGKKFSTKAILVIQNGKSYALLPVDEKEAFGTHIAKEISKDPSSKIKSLCRHFKEEVDNIIGFMEKNIGKTDLKTYTEFWKHVDEYYVPHITCKYVVDYLGKDLLDKYLEDLQEARLYAEPVFTKTEEFIVGLAENIAKKHKYRTNNILCMVKEEMIEYLKTGKLPKEKELENRYGDSALVFENGEHKLYTGKEAVQVEELATKPPKRSELKGQTAYPGKAEGTVRIIFEPEKVKNFKEGGILVTGMTRPEYLPLMKKAAAFITDAGGILSHAAIMARELKKPCVIGTQIATKVLKDGDFVEIDADKGIVRIK